MYLVPRQIILPSLRGAAKQGRGNLKIGVNQSHTDESVEYVLICL